MVINNLLFIFLIKTILNTESECPIIECDDIKNENDTCLIYNPKESNKVFINPCKDNYYCPLQSDEFEEGTLKCIEKRKEKNKKYPGSECESDEDCISGICNDEEECEGKKEYEYCIDTSECLKTLTCINNTCQAIRKLGDFCTEDTDCEMTAGCHKNKCTQYFSLPDGEKVDQKTFFNDGLSFCEKGVAYKGVCMDLRLLNQRAPCDENNPCIYSHEKNKKAIENITIQENCLCGYDGKKYCRLGGLNINYTNYIKGKGEYYKLFHDCHPAEHGLNVPCNNEEHTKNLGIWGLYNYKMYNSKECILKMAFPNYDPTKDSKELLQDNCPRYICNNINENSHICFNKTVYYNDTVDINLQYNNSLKDNLENVECDVKGRTNDIGDTNNYHFNYRYTEINYLPGDYCKETCGDNEKYKCENNRCVFKNRTNKDCKTHLDCDVGEYCEVYSTGVKRCESLKNQDESCVSYLECKNHLLCLNSICSDSLYKILPGNLADTTYACKYNRTRDGVCIKLFYREALRNDYEDFVKCNNQQCLYYQIASENFDEKMIKDKTSDGCFCGYRYNGDKYCALDDNSFPDLIERFHDLHIQLIKSPCHTRNRYHCSHWPYENKEIYDEYISLKMFFENGHMFYKSDDCVEYVMKGFYCMFNRLFLLFIYLIVF